MSARLTGDFKRSALRTLYRQAKAATPVVTLADAIDNFQDSTWEPVSHGQTVTATAQIGRSASFSMPAIWRDFSQEDLFAFAEELQQVYADAKVTLANENINSPTDVQIFNVMIADTRFATITESMKDYTSLRWPTRL